jgi:CRISPR-associated protein (Cas_Cmr5).
MQTRDQKYASDIYYKVMKVSEQGEKAKSYGVMSHKLPIPDPQSGTGAGPRLRSGP